MDVNNLRLSAKHWWLAIRGHTLPLSLAVMLLGNALAYYQALFSWSLAFLSMAVGVLLQIVSNLANDYGDGLRGLDSHRQARQAIYDVLSFKTIGHALYVCSGLTLLLGLILIVLAAFHHQSWALFIGFFLLGALSLWAALAYTLGKKPYGYQALGDVAVWLFFGPVAVMGSYFLQTLQLDKAVFFAAAAMGFWCVAVLNINNSRDALSDKQMGKYTIAALLGKRYAYVYHWVLLVLALVAWSGYFAMRQVAAAPYLWGVMAVVSAWHVYAMRPRRHLCYEKRLKCWNIAILLQTLALLLWGLN